MNAAGEVIGRRSVLNNQAELIVLSKENAGATMIMEAGTHSPWISRLLEGRGHKVIVANPRGVGQGAGLGYMRFPFFADGLEE